VRTLTMPTLRLILAAGMSATLLTPSAIRGDDDVFGITGNADLLWVAATVTEGEGTQQTKTVRFRALRNVTAGFRTLDGLRPVIGQVELLAALGDTLHIVFPSGSQWSCTYHDPSGSQNASGQYQVSDRLPAPEQPMAWSASAKQNAIYAVVTGRAVTQLAPSNRPPPSTIQAKAAAGPDTQPAATDPLSALTEALRARPLAGAMVRFAGGQWRRMDDDLIPEWFDDHRQVWLAASGDTLHILYRPDGADAEIHHAYRPIQPGTAWSKPNSTGVRTTDSPIAAAVMIETSLYFVYDEPKSENQAAQSQTALRVARFHEGTWEAGPYLNQNDQPHLFDASNNRLAVASFGRDIVTGQRTGPMEVRVKFWVPSDGSHRSDNDRTARLQTPKPDMINPQVGQWLLLVTVTVLFMAAFRRRQLARPPKTPTDSNE